MAHNLEGRQLSQIETMSGVITLAQPHDIPEGGSPRTVNTDFTVGSTFTRQGLYNPFTYDGNFAGPDPAGSAVNTNLGLNPWLNPNNIKLDDGSYTTTSLPSVSSFTPTLTCTSSTWANPANATSPSAFTTCPGLAIDFLDITVGPTTVPFGATITGIEITGMTENTGGGTNQLQIYFPIPNLAQYVTTYDVLAPFGLGSDTTMFGMTAADIAAGFQFSFIPSSPTTARSLNNLVVTVYYATPESNALDLTQFGFSIPSGTPQGIQVDITGYATGPMTILIELLKAGVRVGNTQQIPLNIGSPTVISFGGINELFGIDWVFSDFNNVDFGVRIIAFGDGVTPADVFLDYATITLYFLPSQVNFDHISTYQDSFGDIYNLALDAGGKVWIEDVNTAPNVLATLFEGVPANSFAVAFDADSRHYMAFSDIEQGNYPPTQIIGTNAAQTGWQDRVSQVGPGQAPTFQGTLQTSNIANITAYSTGGGVVTLTANNDFSAGEVVTLNIASGPTFLNTSPGPVYNVLGTGLSSTQFEVAYIGASGSGSAVGTAVPQYTYPIEASPNGITQLPFWNSAQGYQSQLDDILWSAGPGSTDAGTVVTIYYLNAFTHQTGIDINLSNAFTKKLFPTYVYVSGTNMPIANGTQLVTSIGIGSPPGGGDQRYYFTFNVPTSGYSNLGGGSNAQPGKYQLTVATVTTTLPLPGVQNGDSITLSGNGITEWNQTWQIVNALNFGVYTISQTSMSNTGVATYDWALANGTANAPEVGQLVTVTGTTSNLNGSGIYNVTDAVIASVTGSVSGTFTITGFSENNVETVVQSGAQATTAGTQFQIDPGPLAAGNSGADPIYGNSGGGYITLVGSSSVVVGTGTRMGTVFFITRNGFWTRPAPPVKFDTSENTNYIIASNIPLGPPNVIARGIVFTEAGQEGQAGASYYTIPVPVTFVYNNVTYVSSALIINDNTTTTAKFTFTDGVLLSAEEIDIPGNDLFALNEIGAAAWCTQYAGRSVYGRVNNKIQNFLNLSFDGGYLPNPGGNLLPLGWNLDAASNPSNSLPNLLVSPIFGNSYYISNQTGNSVASLGMITQPAYQDWENVPILQNSTAYSVRVTVRTPSTANVGGLVIDLTQFDTNTGYGATLGSFNLPTADMTSDMQTYTGTLLTNNTTTIPSDLYLRVWASNLAPAGDIEIDSIEIYPTISPVNLTGITMSYADDLESFDGVTGGNDTSAINQQAANGAFTMLNKLYVVKESSLGHFNEVPDQEPSNWSKFTEDSQVAGACGINAFDVGETWAVMACQNGFYGFNGGQPVALHLEIPDLWAAINWSAGETICVRNDVKNQRIMIAVPMTTPNFWCPTFPVNNNPTTPNVILYLNYSGIGTIEELINGMAMHVTIVGAVAVHDLKRKWSIWSITTPYMAVCKRNQLFSEMLICNGNNTSKIYNLNSYQSGQDDGTPFTSTYCTYGMVSQQKVKETPGFGLLNKRFVYFDALLAGGNVANVAFYENALTTTPWMIPGGLDLVPLPFEDQYGPVDLFGQRIFVEIEVTGTWFNLSRFTVVGEQDPWRPIN